MTARAVSVVIPTYNYGRFVTEAVESVLAQTYPPAELIVIDDGSTDDTRDRLAPYMDRIRYVYQVNQGLPAARNAGIRASQGDLIALLDSDDLWHPRKLEAQLAVHTRFPELGMVAAGNAPDPRTAWPEIGDPASLPVQPITLRDMLVRSRFGPSSVLIRRACFDAIGLFDPDLRSAEDRDMWLRIAARFPVAKVEAPLWWYRLHGGNMSAAAVRMEENEMKVLRRALDSLPGVRGDRLLRLKVLSYTLRSAAYRYDMAGRRVRAMTRVVQSLALWPCPFRKDEAFTCWERPKMLSLFALRLVKRWVGTGARTGSR